MPHTSRRFPFAVLLGLAWLVAALQLLANGWAASAITLPDADDAMRLVEMREFLAGKGWFDLHEARLAPPLGYDSHWSRLIDAGLAATVLGFRAFVAPEMAERLTVVLWPMLWLLPAIAAVAALAWRIGGRDAAFVVLLLAAFSLPAFQQFRPGRIDHHNVHVTLSLASVAAAAWAGAWRPAPWVTGLLAGLALAIGFESLPFVMIAGAAFAGRYVMDRAAGRDLAVYAATLAASTAVAFLVSVGPQHWSRSVCDAIAVNSAVAVILGGVAVGAAGLAGLAERRARSLALGAAAAVALAAFAAFDPRCLGGPFAEVDPAIGPAWIDHVAEVQPLARMLRESAVTGAATIAFPAAALLALMTLLRGRHEHGFVVAAAAFLVAFSATLAMVKVFSYAVWFGLPFMAAALTRIHRLVPRAFAALILTPTAVTLGAIGIAEAAGSRPLDLDTAERQACVSKAGTAPLATLPVGVMLPNELEWGPYILAFTPQAVLAAPYHRLSSVIVTAHTAYAAPPEAAHRIIAASGVDYVVTCGSRGPLGVTGARLDASLWGHLAAGDVPGWLDKVSLAGPYTVYRVRGSRG